MIVEEGPRAGSFKTAYVKPYVKFDELNYVTIIKKLPDKWVEDWPEEKNITIENPFYGELNFPGEEPESKQIPKDQKQTVVKPQFSEQRDLVKKPMSNSLTPPPKKQEVMKKMPLLDEDDEDILRKLEGNSP